MRHTVTQINQLMHAPSLCTISNRPSASAAAASTANSDDEEDEEANRYYPYPESLDQ
jgi:hypothetical protein